MINAIHAPRLRSLLTYLSHFLRPHWRLIFIMIGTRILYESVHVVNPGQGRLLPYQGILGIIYSLISFACFWIATRESLPAWFVIFWDRLPHIFRWRIWYFVILIGTFLIIWRAMPQELPGAIGGNYSNDAIAFVHADAEALLHGHNPFTDNQAFWNAAKRWPNALATPILGSQDFGSNPFHYPSFTTMQRLLQNQYDNPALRNNDFNVQTISTMLSLQS